MSERLVEIQLLRVPVGVYERASLHQQALQREFDVISSGDSAEDPFPRLLLDVVRDLDGQFGRFGRPGHAQLDEAVARGDDEVDVTYRVPPEAGDAAARLAELLDRADDYCRSGTHLLTLATPDELLDFRRWFLSEFVGQIDGAEPTPWPDWVSKRSRDRISVRDDAGREITASDSPSRLPNGWGLGATGGHATLSVSGELDFDSASDLRNALQAARVGATTVTVDGRGVTFIDSLAISVLIAARNRLVQEHTVLRIEAGPTFFRTLELAGLVEPLGVVRVPEAGRPGGGTHARA